MNTNKFLIGGIAGGIASFLLGWLIYGKLLMDYYGTNCVSRPETDMVMWALVVGNFALGFLLSYIFNKWANINTAGGGMQAGAILGLFMGLGYDMIIYGTSTMMTLNNTLVDVVVTTVITALVGTVVGMASGMVKTTA